MNEVLKTEKNNIQKFYEMEEKYHLFDFKTKDGIKYWDIVRYNIFAYIISNINIPPPKKYRNILLSDIYRKLVKLVIFLWKVFISRPQYLCFICSRNKDKNGKNIDIISQDIVSRLPARKRLVIETYADSSMRKGQFNYISNSGLIMGRHLFNFKNIILNNNFNENFEILEIIANVFDVSINDKITMKSIIINDLNCYRMEKNYYRKLFLLLRPKLIFLVQNGIQKGMFNAANYLKIPIVELQHGFIGYRHPAYSYPQSLHGEQVQDLPQYFFAFSHFWTKEINFPVKSIRYIGNSYYAGKIVRKEMKYDITFVMGTYNNCLLVVIEDLLAIGYNGKICIKSHPNQISEHEEFIKRFKATKNISIIRNELSISELLAETGCIVTVDSTCIYEALHNNVRVLLLNVPGYQTMQNIYDNPLVKVINSADDIITLKYNDEIEQENKVTYFEDFNEKEFYHFLDELALC